MSKLLHVTFFKREQHVARLALEANVRRSTLLRSSGAVYYTNRLELLTIVLILSSSSSSPTRHSLRPRIMVRDQGAK